MHSKRMLGAENAAGNVSPYLQGIAGRASARQDMLMRLISGT